jgi:hypothetical protein
VICPNPRFLSDERSRLLAERQYLLHELLRIHHQIVIGGAAARPHGQGSNPAREGGSVKTRVEQRPCWVPVVAACPHCQTTLRVLGPADLSHVALTNFRYRHFENRPSNPAAIAARKAQHELLCLSHD